MKQEIYVSHSCTAQLISKLIFFMFLFDSIFILSFSHLFQRASEQAKRYVVMASDFEFEVLCSIGSIDTVK